MRTLHRLRLTAALTFALTSFGCELGFRAQPLRVDAAARVDARVVDVRDVAPSDDTAALDAGPCGACTEGRMCCGDRCVDLTTDPTNCGACGAACRAANATSACAAGRCVFSCLPGADDCDGVEANGCEADLNTSVVHCGQCRAPCSDRNNIPNCNTGRCVRMCESGWGDCDGDLSNGCETNIRTTATHCGGCGVQCPPPNRNSVFCINGACQVGACEVGWQDCNRNPNDGCETNVAVDVANCGSCRNGCTGAAGLSATCVGGRCGTTTTCTPTTLGDCDGMAANGCESDLTAATAHCGRCGNACSANNGAPRCVSGACQITCSPGFGDCDGLVTNGCETNLLTATNHCNMCRGTCALPNTRLNACMSGACIPVDCNAGFGNCDGVLANGCETNTNTTAAHCGACGRACNLPHATPQCRDARCQIAPGGCELGWADCDNNPTNGCEVDLRVTTAHCGMCRAPCILPNGGAICRGSMCAVTACATYWSDCDRNPATGCEIATGFDPNNCGACGVRCAPPNPRCSVGRCMP